MNLGILYSDGPIRLSEPAVLGDRTGHPPAALEALGGLYRSQSGVLRRQDRRHLVPVE